MRGQSVLLRYRSYATRAAVTDLDFEQMRRAMVASQLRTTAVNDPGVVANDLCRKKMPRLPISIARFRWGRGVRSIRR
jgi:hypothetical protein